MMSDKKDIPQHIAIIMDGNGRWAKQRGLPRMAGHRAGIKMVKEIVKEAAALDIRVLTLFAFSTENWQRPDREISMLMRSFVNFLSREIRQMHKNNLRFRVIGRKKPLPKYLLSKIKDAEKLTAANTGLTVVLALNYGGRAEIADAAAGISRAVQAGDFNAGQIDEGLFSRFLYAPDLPCPDLLIRTSGEFRMSNFLLWQSAYTELYFVKKYWPDFTRLELQKAVAEYKDRSRRFGGL